MCYIKKHILIVDRNRRGGVVQECHHTAAGRVKDSKSREL
jgi:hypothetical protein